MGGCGPNAGSSRSRRSRCVVLVGLLVVCLAFAGGCGEEQARQAPPPGPLDGVLRYFHLRAAAVNVLPTDLRGEQWRAFDRALTKRLFDGGSAEQLVRGILEDERLSYRRDVRPLLGNYLVLGLPRARGLVDEESGLLAALQVRDGDKLRRVLRRQRWFRRAGSYRGASLYIERDFGLGLTLAVDGDVLLAADGPHTIRRALRQRTRADRLTETRFDHALAGLPANALVRGYGDLFGTLRHPELRRFRVLPWVDSLRTAGFAAKFHDRRLQLDLVLNSDPGRVRTADLPFPPGAAAPALFRRERQVVGGSANQSQTTVFLLRAVRAGHPRSRFVRHVRRIERELHIDFEDEVLRQFNGPSMSVLGLDGRFAARSTVAGPGRMAPLLKSLAPRLPRLVQDLNRLETPGLSLLLLFAPDAPVAADRIKGPRVRRLPGPGQLYRMSGLRRGRPPPENPEVVPRAVVFGLLGDVFVVASDERRARRIAREPASPISGLAGASVTRANLGRMRRSLRDYLGFDPGRLGLMTGAIRATPRRVWATGSVEFR